MSNIASIFFFACNEEIKRPPITVFSLFNQEIWQPLAKGAISLGYTKDPNDEDELW